jgi:hypothetical protein
MRIDDIDLFGPFRINGTIGTEGQILGFSGSRTHWITASGSGGSGGPGPQGPTGSSTGFSSFGYNSFNIIFQSPTGLTSSFGFIYCRDSPLHGSNTNTGNYSTFLSAISANDGTMEVDTYCSSIIASKGSIHKYGRFNTHIGGCYNQIGYNQYNVNYRSAILGGRNNCISAGGSPFLSSVIGGGCLNYICGPNIKYNSIFGGCFNVLQQSLYSSIIGGDCNFISSAYVTFENKQVSIIGGCRNHIIPGLLVGNYFHENSAILGGKGTSLISPGGNVCNSVIIGGCGTQSSGILMDHYLSRNNSVIVGGKDIKVPVINYSGRQNFFDNALFLNYGVITNNMKLNDYTTTVGLTGFGGTNSRANVILNQKQSGFSNYISFWGSSGIRQRFRICT